MPLTIYTQGDRPTVAITSPEQNGQVGGIITVTGSTSIAINSVDQIWIQIDPDFNGTFASNWEEKLDPLLNGKTEQQLGYKLEDSGDTTGTIGNAIKANGSKTSWNLAINKASEYNKKDANGNYLFRWQERIIMNILSNEKYKGEAILQKTYIEDFLTHKKVKNDGKDVPIYHVKDSHPFIIPVEEWEMVQVEMKRRGKRYSSLSVFGSKIICGDCGSCYGQKVWHSNDSHRKMIYRCNRKYDNKNNCKTPTITEEIIKKAFVDSCRLMDKSDLIDDLNIGLKTLENHKKLDDKIMELVIECDALNESARKLIEDKKKGIVGQHIADERYGVLVKKHKEVSNELKKLEEQRSLKAASACRVKMHIKALKENQIPLDEFQIKWWSLLLEKAVVHRDNRIEFIYYSGYKNEITIH